MGEVQQNPFRPAQKVGARLARRLRRPYVRRAFELAITPRILFVFFNGRAFSTEYDLTPTGAARLI
ncbi:hypothetical protein NDK50_23950 [Paraburkholderia bryophila]|uniref:hypothetical protein n=1 Tax=Paraburkholderia bryophila TaxID=420952 RepID=UPI00234B3C75|nr:hypothetical protein [Paraburkholderia bryophila]WCM23900.1 hypothetical protein NDK50_23950 [Paraburkholderia bryophila]